MSSEDSDSDVTDKDSIVIKINGHLIGTVPKGRKFFLAFQHGPEWVNNSYQSPVDFEVLLDMSQNNWSRSSQPGQNI